MPAPKTIQESRANFYCTRRTRSSPPQQKPAYKLNLSHTRSCRLGFLPTAFHLRQSLFHNLFPEKLDTLMLVPTCNLSLTSSFRTIINFPIRTIKAPLCSSIVRTATLASLRLQGRLSAVAQSGKDSARRAYDREPRALQLDVCPREQSLHQPGLLYRPGCFSAVAPLIKRSLNLFQRAGCRPGPNLTALSFSRPACSLSVRTDIGWRAQSPRAALLLALLILLSNCNPSPKRTAANLQARVTLGPFFEIVVHRLESARTLST